MVELPPGVKRFRSADGKYLDAYDVVKLEWEKAKELFRLANPGTDAP
jgi:hypothetical protein